MKAQDLKNSILQLAIEGKLVPQNLDDVPAKELLAQIEKEKEQLIRDKKIKRNSKESVIFRDNGHFYEKVGKKGEPICIDDEIPFDIPDTWEWVKLKNITKLGDNLNIHTRLNKDTIINYVDIKAIDNKNYCIKEDNIKNEKVINLSSRARRVLEKDQIIYSLVRPYLNNIAIITENKDNYIGTTGLIAFKTLIETKYVFYYLLSPIIREYYLRILKGFNSPSITQTQFLNTYIPVPPLNEQKRIVNKIEELRPYVEEYGEAEEKLEGLNETFPEKIKASILQEAVQGKLVPQNLDDVPAKELLAQIRKEKEQLIRDKKIKRNSKESVIFRDNGHFYEKVGKKGEPICIDDEIPFDIPESWIWCRLGDILIKLTDGTHNTPKYTDSGIPFLSVKDMSSGKLIFSNTKYISKEEHDALYKRCNPEKNDVLLTKVGTTGIPVLVDTDKEFSLFVSVALLKFNHDLIYNKYLITLIKSPLVRKQCIENTKGVGNKNLVLRDINKSLIVLPPLEEQKRIVKKIEQLLKICEKLLITL